MKFSKADTMMRKSEQICNDGEHRYRWKTNFWIFHSTSFYTRNIPATIEVPQHQLGVVIEAAGKNQFHTIVKIFTIGKGLMLPVRLFYDYGFVIGWLYGSFNGRMGSLSEDTITPITKKDLSRTGSFQDTRSRHSSGMVGSTFQTLIYYSEVTGFIYIKTLVPIMHMLSISYATLHMKQRP